MSDGNQIAGMDGRIGIDGHIVDGGSVHGCQIGDEEFSFRGENPAMLARKRFIVKDDIVCFGSSKGSADFR